MVETASGVSAFVLAFWLDRGHVPHKQRQAAQGSDSASSANKPHNLPFVLLGAGRLHALAAIVSRIITLWVQYA